MPDLASWSEDDHHLNDSEAAWEKSVDRTKPISNSLASTWLGDLSSRWTGLCAARVVDEPFSMTVRLMKKPINVMEWPQSCRKAAKRAEGLKSREPKSHLRCTETWWPTTRLGLQTGVSVQSYFLLEDRYFNQWHASLSSHLLNLLYNSLGFQDLQLIFCLSPLRWNYYIN